SAFFGMATAYAESVLAQIFKEKKDDELVGGLPYYGRKLLGDRKIAGIALSVWSRYKSTYPTATSL
ncbi:MAG: alanine:cation symporter family protein, partial [Tidjanibacter sp.]|nr:alanine:cation symporter family protein [Tidjanibacter sp.]